MVGNAYYLAPKQGARTTRTGKTTYRRLWRCGACRQQFSVLVGTVMEDSKIPVSKWLLAIHMLNAGKNGVSALESSRTLGIGNRAAWFMAHRIRYAVAPQHVTHSEQEQPATRLQGVVEADETYIGVRARGKRGRGAANKTPVFTLVERNGEARSQVVTNVTGEKVRAILQRHVEADATLMTDSYQVYRQPGRAFAAHHTVDHGAGEYARSDSDPDRQHAVLTYHDKRGYTMDMPERSSTSRSPLDAQLPQESTPEKNPAAVALGRLGGKRGGPARAQMLTPEQRHTIARDAALSRWSKQEHAVHDERGTAEQRHFRTG